MTDLGQEFTVTGTLGTSSLGTSSLSGTGTPVIGRRVMPTPGPQTGNDPAAFHRIMLWLQGRPGRGSAARRQVEHPAEVNSREPSVAAAGGSVWGNVCGCACG